MTNPTAEADGILGELFMSASAYADPYPRFAKLRELAPIHTSGLGFTVFSRHGDCNEVLRDNRFGKEVESPSLDMPKSILRMNPPDHTRVRALVSRAFTPRRVAALQEGMRDLAAECFDDMADATECDLLEALGFRFPVAVIGTLVGVPRSQWPRFRELTTTTGLALEPNVSAEQLSAAGEAIRESWDRFRELVAERRARPRDDLLSAMLEVSDGSDRLNEGELIATANLMFSAGFETTTNLIGNGVVALLHHPHELARLRRDPGLVPGAVEEILRWDSPVQLDGRTALEDVEFAGHHIEKGSRVVTLLGSANRDPAVYDDPDTFDVTRVGPPPMSFASGIHYCLGANLAKAEGEVVFSGLLDRFSALELTAEPVHRPRLTLRGYETVPIRVTPR